MTQPLRSGESCFSSQSQHEIHHDFSDCRRTREISKAEQRCLDCDDKGGSCQRHGTEATEFTVMAGKCVKCDHNKCTGPYDPGFYGKAGYSAYGVYGQRYNHPGCKGPGYYDAPGDQCCYYEGGAFKTPGRHNHLQNEKCCDSPHKDGHNPCLPGDDPTKSPCSK